MAITFCTLKKWFCWVMDFSELHVKQGVGKCFSVTKIKGYYNDLRKKVEIWKTLDAKGLPLFLMPDGSLVYWPVTIFQYGLGAYDTYLLENNKTMLEILIKVADWGIENQEDNGAWLCPVVKDSETRYSSMDQGEGISVMLRAYQETHDEKYAVAAHKAVKFMLLSDKEGGTTLYKNNEVYLLESPEGAPILNGWIFSLFGLYDYLLLFNDPEVKLIYERTLKTMKDHLPDYDNGYWSMYDMGGRIASPFYHDLHIALMDALFSMTGDKTFREIEKKWAKYQKSFLKRTRSFVAKAIQKIKE